MINKMINKILNKCLLNKNAKYFIYENTLFKSKFAFINVSK